jgi:hypothetical protein
MLEKGIIIIIIVDRTFNDFYLKEYFVMDYMVHHPFGSTWGHNFYMGMQNGSKLEI